MSIDIVCRFLKYIGVNVGLSYSFYKITNNYKNLSPLNKFIILSINFVISIFQAIATEYISPFYIYIPTSTLFGMLYGRISNMKFEKSFSVSIISLAFSYIASIVPILLCSAILTFLVNIPYVAYLAYVVMLILHLIIVYVFFKAKRFKNGFSFIENDFLRLILLFTTTVIILSYVITEDLSNAFLWFAFVIIGIMCIIVIKQAFTIYQKQKNQLKTLKEYEQELAETKQKLSTALEEKEKIVKSNHEFYHRQEALKAKINSVIAGAESGSMNSEFAEEFSSIMDRINNLSDEYSNKLTSTPKLSKTGKVEIDDMLTYMQGECIKNNIEFVFNLNCNINKILENCITTSELETLLGDLIRNSIIAISHSDKKFRGIMVVFGMVDSTYQIDIYDSGINFEIDTLLKLGLEKCSTHIDDGGSGIGFITTFETLSSCNASLIITELDSSNYSKSISIRFDDLHTYIIKSYRANEIENRLQGTVPFGRKDVQIIAKNVE